MTSFRALQVGILALVVFLSAESGAQADDGTVSREWISSDWDVWCPDPESEDVGRCEGYETAASVFINYLASASQWYESLGFLGPKVINKLGRYQAYIVHSDDAHDAQGQAFSGLYEPNAKLIVLNGDDFFAMGESGEAIDSVGFRVGESFTYASVHELFHAIEATYADDVCGEGRGWICEGMADAALRAYADKFEPEMNIAMKRRLYHEPLHQPSKREWGYGTWQFWLDVGEHLNSMDRIRYFRQVMSKGLDMDHGLVGVDHALKDLMTNDSDEAAIWDQAGLYEVLPWFFTQHDPAGLFPSPLRRTVQLNEDQNSAKEQITDIAVQQVAGRNLELTVRKPAGNPAAVKISFAEPHEDLHLIVNKRRFDKIRGDNRNVFFDIYDDAQELKFDVVIANVAKMVQTSREVKVDLVVEVLTEFASMAIDAASETLVQDGIDLDQVRMSQIIPALTAPQQKAGFARPCALRLTMSSSRTGDTLELHMDHEGPISVGAFPVVSLQKGRYQPPEDHPNRFVLSFGIGKNNIVSGGYDQGFGARSGTVFIDRISLPFIQGRVEVVGERQISGKYVDGEWVEFPANLETVPIGAVFRLMLELPPGTQNRLTMDRCFVDENEDIGGGDGGTTSATTQGSDDGGTEEEAEEESSNQQSDDAENGDALAGNQVASAAPSTAETTHAGEFDSRADDSGLATVDPPCRPLYFAETEQFADNSKLPFTFLQPLGWLHASDGGKLTGSVYPAEYRDSGIRYDARWARNDSDLAMADGLQKATWEQIGQTNFGNAQIEIYGGKIGDSINTYAILPIGERNLILEVRFLGRHDCSIDAPNALQLMFWKSITPS